MNKNSKIYVAGHRGLVGSAIVRNLEAAGFTNLVMATSQELDLREQSATRDFFEQEKPEYVFLAAARVGGILANNQEMLRLAVDLGFTITLWEDDPTVKHVSRRL